MACHHICFHDDPLGNSALPITIGCAPLTSVRTSRIQRCGAHGRACVRPPTPLGRSASEETRQRYGARCSTTLCGPSGHVILGYRFPTARSRCRSQEQRLECPTRAHSIAHCRLLHEPSLRRGPGKRGPDELLVVLRMIHGGTVQELWRYPPYEQALAS